MDFLGQPALSHRLGDYLKENLSGPWTHFRAAVAFVKRSGTRHIVAELAEFSRTRHVEIVAGIDHRGTSAEGLRDLLNAVRPNGRILVFHNLMPSTFHPKVYLFKSPDTAELLIGSGNLTEGGLFTNYEATMRLTLDLCDPDHTAVLQSVETTLDTWMDTESATARVVDAEFLDQLIELGLVPSEALAAQETDDTKSLDPAMVQDSGSIPADAPFVARPVPRAPAFPMTGLQRDLTLKELLTVKQEPTQDLISPELEVTHFLMTLQRTDVGVGQTTTGTSRRSPEIFIPLSARDAAPEFWAWPGEFTSDPARPDKRDRQGVCMRLGTNIINVNMMTWPAKHDFRLRCEALRSAGNIGDILHLEKVDPAIGFEYFAENHPSRYEQLPDLFCLVRSNCPQLQEKVWLLLRFFQCENLLGRYRILSKDIS